MRYEGDIYRPPGEWKSYLLQCTVGCSNNTCTYCGMYKDKQFHIRPLEEIHKDIEMARVYYGGAKTRVFLCDGDAIVMRQEDLISILDHLYEAFPNLEKVTTYAGPRSTLSKTPEQLAELCRHGLKRAYLGVETGSDGLLHSVHKGVTAQQMLEAGIRLREAGFDLWIMVLMGLAGQGSAARDHILATAEMINEMQPRHVSSMTLQLVPGTPLYEDMRAGRFQPQTAQGILEETRLLLQNIKYGPIHFTSDHASNYLALKGTIPEEAPQMIAAIDSALAGEKAIRPEWMRGL